MGSLEQFNSLSLAFSQLQWLGLQAVVYLMIGLSLLYAAAANYLGEQEV
jgi:hypothetical protein